MKVLRSTVDRHSEAYRANVAAQETSLSELSEQVHLACEGGGAPARQRHRSRGRLLARERIELLLDEGSPFLEFSTLAGWGTDYAVGGAVVTGLGVVAGVECVVIANDPTVRGGAINPYTLRKYRRALQIARSNRLPVINLVESAGGDLRADAELFVDAGHMFRGLTELSAAGIPTIAVVFGNATAGGAYVPGMSDYAVLVESRAKVFLAGPPLVKMATGEDSDDESLGGAQMHARVSGLGDHLAVDEHDGIRIAREIVDELNWRKLGPGPSRAAEPPIHDEEELLGIAPADSKVPMDALEVLARVVDGSRFGEYKPLYGSALITGWASVHGYPIGVLINSRGVLFSEEAKKATEFIQLANQQDVPLVFMHNCTGYMVGKSYEEAGIIKDGAKMINAVANSTVPHITINLAASFGAGNYGMSGKAFDPRFIFSWPNAKLAVMGGQQLAGVLSIVDRQAAAAAGKEVDSKSLEERTAALEAQVNAQSHAFFISGRVLDDGVIDPRDTRTVLGMCLSAIHSDLIEGRRGYGVFRM